MTSYKQQDRQARERDTNPDPITGTPGSHPVGTGVGAAGGGAAGAAIGTVVGGPIGGLAGAAIGAIAGGLAGKGTAEAIDPTVELEYWRDAHTERPYYDPKYSFDDYEPAYRYGLESRSRLTDKDWVDVEGNLERKWSEARGHSPLMWEGAREAVRDAWDRRAEHTPDPSHRRR